VNVETKKKKEKIMKQALMVFLVMFTTQAFSQPCGTKSFTDYAYDIHSTDRSYPEGVDPGTPSSLEKAGQPPSDAIVLFDGSDLSQWLTRDGEPADWNVENGYIECVPGKSTIYTKMAFGDCQLHIEWATPAQVEGQGQGRGNSGVYLMGKYEVQVLDSYENTTYPDGQAAALYGQYPPLVNASREPGVWQFYDIIFHRPRFSPTGEVIEPATVTVLHNGVLVQDHTRLTGPTMNRIRLDYYAHESRLPISLQNHRNPVRFRNIWVRDLEKDDKPTQPSTVRSDARPDITAMAGTFQNPDNPDDRIVLAVKEGQLFVKEMTIRDIALHPQSEHSFYAHEDQLQINIRRNREGKVSSVRVFQRGKMISYDKVVQ
jgi:hypothetical protein